MYILLSLSFSADPHAAKHFARAMSAMPSPSMQAEMQDNYKVESEAISQLATQKEELLSKVGTLKKELLEWRTKLDGQVKGFRGVRAWGLVSVGELQVASLWFELSWCVHGHACRKENLRAMSHPMSHGPCGSPCDCRRSLTSDGH